jgi:hypothetical protein
MALRTESYFSSNWHIDELVLGQLIQHEQGGWFNTQERIYMGNTNKLDRVIYAFELILPTLEFGSRRLFVRRSCTDSQSKKYTIVGLYLSNKPRRGTRTVHHATWIAPERDSEAKIISNIKKGFTDFLVQNDFSPAEPQFTEGFSI